MRVLVVAGLLAGTAVAIDRPARADVVSFARPGSSRTGTSGPETSGTRVLPAWTNLLHNPGAEVGDASAEGWDAVTIPGWAVQSGLPTVVRYGTSRFPSRRAEPPGGGRQLFAGGAGGTAILVQDVPIHFTGAGASTDRAGADRANTPVTSARPGKAGAGEAATYRLSAWLGGTATSDASVQVNFLTASGRTLSRAKTRPVGSAPPRPGEPLTKRSISGVVPAGAAVARVAVVLATSLTDYDGPDAPVVGYDRAVADEVGFGVSEPVQAPPPLRPPIARVPHFDHVFLFYFENEDLRSVIGNTLAAPYLNSLLSKGSLLADMFAEEHPSDGNYLAISGGSTFGIPLDDPAEEDNRYTIDARNIGDLVDAAHESWKGYLQSADGPCDDTVHPSNYYWDDDGPMFYYRDVIDRPKYCAAHLVPLPELSADLAHASTTPSFAWIMPNDCTDMEGCGISAGDSFLASVLGEIMRSPAWTSQPSLAIITFDEDGYDYERPAQLIPTVIVGSRQVRSGYTSFTRYTHYSLLRTIEAALGLGTLTDNDLYAQAVNDVFK